MKLKLLFYLFVFIFLSCVSSSRAQQNNTTVGNGTGATTNGIYNSFVGVNSGQNNQVGKFNSAFGSNSLSNSIDGNNNVAIGSEALKMLVGSDGIQNGGSNNTAVGYRSMGSSSRATNSVAIGYESMGMSMVSNQSIGIGYQSLYSNNAINIGIGYRAGFLNNTGTRNIFLGWMSGYINEGSDNTFLGNSSFRNNTTGNNNIGIGNLAGFANTTGSNNIYLGKGHYSYNDGGTGSGNIVIGNNIVLPDYAGDNCIILGDGSHNKNAGTIRFFINNLGNAGIGTVTPKSRLEIKSDVNSASPSGLRFTNLTSNFVPAANQTSTKFLTVDDEGDVVLQYAANTNITHALTSVDNTMTSQVNAITSSASIVNSISNTITSTNQLITKVNGVASNPVSLPVPTFTEVDGSVTNELQTLSQTGNTITLSNGGGSFTLPTYNDTDAQALTLAGNNLSISNGNTVVLPTTHVIAGSNVTVTGNGTTTSPFQVAAQDDDEQSLSLVGNNLSISNGNTVVLPSFTEVDGSVTNELQTLTQTGNTISLSNGGGSFNLPVDTDNQTLALTGNTLSIADGNSVILPTTHVIAGTNVTVTGNGTTTSPFQIAAQDDDEQSLSLVGNNLSISNGNTVVLPTFTEVDGSVTNELQTLTQTGNTISLSNGGGSFTLPVDTDNQTLALTGNTLSIADGNSVILPTTHVIAGTNVTVTGNGTTTSPFQIAAQDDDEQSLTLVGNNLSISNGNTVVLPTFTEVDGSVTNELQTLTQTGNTITLSNGGGSFTLPTFTDTDTDAQSLTLTGNNLTISNGNTVALPTTHVTAGANVIVSGAGTSASPFVIASNDTSLYSANGSINPATTTNNNRIVNMNNRNIWFNTLTSSSNGKIYIGSTPNYPTTTGDYKLFVEGGILTEKVKVALRSTTNWADYVFDKNYELMPLTEVEKFIATNKHLPGIDSAETLFKNGIDVADMQAKQMEKIEELTLYVISQNKAIESQNKEIEELKLQVKALIEKTK